MALKNAGTSHTWNKVAKMYNLVPLKSDLEVFEGDFNLMSDAPVLFQELSDLPNTYRFCGPLLNTKQIEWPECIRNYKESNKVKIFVTMGSSGEQEILLHILDLLRQIDADIFIATTSIFEANKSMKFPDNFYFAEAFPHVEMASWVDLSIIHGGQGTVYATILGGKPYIGIPMFSEQEYNLQNLEKFKCGITLSVSNIDSLIPSVEMLLKNKQFEENMGKLKEEIIPYCELEASSKRAVNEILNFLEMRND